MKATNTFKGTRDISGDDMRFRLQTLDTIRNVFELFGFEPLETPVIERRGTLLGKYGEEAENLLFMLGTPHDNGGLRYDHTVPLARFAAAHWQDMPKPYKRYALGPVFRAENPQSGRYRQFYQCDFDTLGTGSVVVDAEIVAINYKVLAELGFKDKQFAVQVNDRKLLNSMVSEMGFNKAQVPFILRAWDKLDKNSPDEVLDYLLSEAKKMALSEKEVEQKYKSATLALLDATTKSSQHILDFLADRFKSEESLNAVHDLRKLREQILSLGVPEVSFQINPLLARGLSYYTGPIFETVVRDGGVGSVTGGGRYDELISTMGGPDVPASGSSFGLDRLLVVTEQLGLRPKSSQTTKVFVSLFDSLDEKLTAYTLHVAGELRENNIAAEVFSGENTKLGKQIELADKKNIPYVLIVGPDEMDKGLVTLKNLENREEKKLSLEKLTSEIG
ncbi:histidine--tRNA ligase [Candidatus Microgenomates bacterium]|nr:MAG: histidine--tRNA ligase [Candidatus Microgenomates bacterium]